MNVDDLVAQKIEAARRRIAADKADRARRKTTRDAGLILRHATKLRHLAATSNATPAATGG
ncbi:MAG: hypothetical protein JWO67_1955 [Streptosporangiaceae bacterium]|nr:hypothetical protein [Streptosporangiaceae bacterium]